MLTVFDAFAEPQRIGEEVVLVDEFGQYEAMVTADYLCQIGKRVTHVRVMVTRVSRSRARASSTTVSG